MAIDETPALPRRVPPSSGGDTLHGGGGVGKSAPIPPTSPSSQFVANEAPLPPVSANQDIAWIWQTMKMKNVTTKHIAHIDNTDAIVNAGIADKIFSESAMRCGVVP